MQINVEIAHVCTKGEDGLSDSTAESLIWRPAHIYHVFDAVCGLEQRARITNTADGFEGEFSLP